MLMDPQPSAPALVPVGSLPLYIDSTMLVAFRACPRKFFWEYVECLSPAGRAIDLVAGGAFAAGLEAAQLAHYQDGLDTEGALEAAYVAFAESWGDMPDPHPTDDRRTPSPKSFDRTFGALLYYLTEAYPFERDHVKPLLRTDTGRPAFEFSFAVPLTDPKFPRHPSGDPYFYCGRFDTFGQIDAGHNNHVLCIRDEKTTGRGFAYNWADQWNLRNQFILYCWIAQQSGFLVNTFVVRGIAIQKTQYQHIEAIKVYPQNLIERATDQLARDLHRLNDCYRSEYFDYNFGDSCSAFGRPCAFQDLCVDEKPARWFNDFPRARWEPLTRTRKEIPRG